MLAFWIVVLLLAWCRFWLLPRPSLSSRISQVDPFEEEV